jgi:hypothetical protein
MPFVRCVRIWECRTGNANGMPFVLRFLVPHRRGEQSVGSSNSGEAENGRVEMEAHDDHEETRVLVAPCTVHVLSKPKIIQDAENKKH